ncbi:MAG TPA: hypothetical protein VN618_08330 [Solirubrobacteraceae bacterium]|nr:hypothetical protein [Solirubrobacteraceae bacterium]
MSPPAAHSGERHGAGSSRPPRVRGEERDRIAREALSPLEPDERPRALSVAIVLCLVLAAGVIAGAASVHDLSRHGGSLPGAATIAVVLALLAQGMYRHRYWAVLSFEALLAFQIIVTSLALIVASTIAAALVCAVGIGLGGWLFWKLVRVMGRIQAGEPPRV